MKKIIYVEHPDSLLGISEIDYQHGMLVSCVERLLLWESKGHGFAALLDAIAALSDYAHVHFSYEENFLRNRNYSKLAEQIAEHRRFTDELARISNRISEEEISSEAIIAFVKNWITEHISNDDVAFSNYLAESPRK